VQDPLALKILDGEVLNGDHVVVDAVGDQMRFSVERGAARRAPEQEPARVA
jgi:hypothetical protein